MINMVLRGALRKPARSNRRTRRAVRKSERVGRKQLRANVQLAQQKKRQKLFQTKQKAKALRRSRIAKRTKPIRSVGKELRKSGTKLVKTSTKTSSGSKPLPRSPLKQERRQPRDLEGTVFGGVASTRFSRSEPDRMERETKRTLESDRPRQTRDVKGDDDLRRLLG